MKLVTDPLYIYDKQEQANSFIQTLNKEITEILSNIFTTSEIGKLVSKSEWIPSTLLKDLFIKSNKCLIPKSVHKSSLRLNGESWHRWRKSSTAGSPFLSSNKGFPNTWLEQNVTYSCNKGTCKHSCH